MQKLLLKIVYGMIFASAALLLANGQASPSQSADPAAPTPNPAMSVPPPPASPDVSAPSTPAPSSTPAAASTPSTESLPPATPEAEETLVDPASLLPDLPKLPEAKASLIGGTVGKLDRVRDQITVQVFGGGKMKIFFDPRTHVYHDGAEASLADLHQGDRIYVETILDGSSVFARAIRLKTTTSAGESQGLVTNYNPGKGELELRDALSPRTVKIRITPQTRILEGDRASSAAKLTPGTLVSIKFGSHNNGAEIASEVSVLASPGDSFTFSGQVTAIDLRLGLMVIASSTDHKTYEIYLDPSTMTLDDSIRPSVDVTVLTRFQGNHYVARSVTVIAPVQR